MPARLTPAHPTCRRFGAFFRSTAKVVLRCVPRCGSILAGLLLDNQTVTPATQNPPERKESRIVKLNWAESLREAVHGLAESLGNLLVESFHYLALFAIGGITAWAAVLAVCGMLEKGHITVDDILLLFIYLELGAMVGIYFKTNHMPVRFLIYVAITALTRLLISDVSHHNRPGMEVVYVSGAILLLALAILVVRFASSRFPAVQSDARRGRDGDAQTLD